MGTGLFQGVRWWLGRASYVFVVLTVLAGLLAGCGFGAGNSQSENTPCIYGTKRFPLVLVHVVCIRAEPTRSPDGAWSYSLSQTPQAAQLTAGSILVVAGKSVRKVESAPQRTGDRITFTTVAVPLTEVVKDGTIPLTGSITPGSITKIVDRLPPAPPPEPAQITVSPTPSQSSGSPSQGANPVISASVQTLRSAYKGACSAASAGQEPTFEATITVSAGPVIVAYHWALAGPGGSTTFIPGTLKFPGTGQQMLTADYSVPVDQYPTGVNRGQISLQVDSPSSTAAPEQPSYIVACLPSTVSPSPNPATDTSGAASGSLSVGHEPASLLADVFPSVGCYHFEPLPSLTFDGNSFLVDVTATCQVGLVKLTWKIHGELDGFLSGGAIRIVNHQLQDSGLDTSRLRGQLRLDWILSAALPQSVADRLSLDMPIRLFVEPLFAGDFPVFLAVDIRFHVGPGFTSGQALHGYASMSFTGGQGLHIHLGQIDHPYGPLIRRAGLAAGITRLFGLPTLQAWVDFPYLSLGDDIYSTGSWLWASPRIEVDIVPGHDPGLCARAEPDVSATAGIEFQLFGLGATLSTQLFDHPLPPAMSFPPSPECITS